MYPKLWTAPTCKIRRLSHYQFTNQLRGKEAYKPLICVLQDFDEFLNTACKWKFLGSHLPTVVPWNIKMIYVLGKKNYDKKEGVPNNVVEASWIKTLWQNIMSSERTYLFRQSAHSLLSGSLRSPSKICIYSQHKNK